MNDYQQQARDFITRVENAIDWNGAIPRSDCFPEQLESDLWHAFKCGAAVAFGLMGMAEAIRLWSLCPLDYSWCKYGNRCRSCSVGKSRREDD